MRFHLFTTIPTLIYLATYWISSGIFALLDYSLDNKTLSKHKIQSERIDWIKYKKTAKKSFYNQILITIPTTYLTYPLWQYNSLEFPTLTEVIQDFIYNILILEVLFFTVHYLFHNPRFYKYHKVHHEWIAPVACRANYAHPLEHLILNTLVPLAGPIITKSSVYFLYFWLVLSTFSITATHSGYNWNILHAEKHDKHHQYFNKNYGIFGICDYICNTKI